jgi:hypothetical protein
MRDGWDDDDKLLAALRDALHTRRAVPPEFIEAGKNAFAWRNIDAELAELTYDSTQGPDPAPVTRTDAASIRALTFTSARLTVELEVRGGSLLGQLVPAQAATVEVETRAGQDTEIPDEIPTDEIGCFSVQPVPRGPFRLRCRATGGIDVLTGWVTLLLSCGPEGNEG